MRVEILLLALLPLAWLLPNHYWPWAAAWQEGLALFLLAAYTALSRGRAAVLDRHWIWAAIVCVVTATVQWVTGHLLYGGDALLTVLYLGAFLCALAAGSQLAADAADAEDLSAFDLLMIGVLASAMLCVVIGIWQWGGTSPFGLLVVEQKPGVSPYSNLAQPNHFADAVVLGLCAAGWLRSRRRIGGAVFWACAFLMVFGVVLSGSRAGLIELLMLCGLVAVSRSPVRARFEHIALLGAMTVGLYLFWHSQDALAVRAVSDQANAGARMPLWMQMLDAITRHPWVGYGWNQTVLAQELVSVDHPPLQRHFEQSHNQLLDIFIWVGVPIGLVVLYYVSRALWSALREATSPPRFWIGAAVAVLLLHSMVEFPLTYTYFLLPFGIWLGYLAPSMAGRQSVVVPAVGLRLAGAVLTLFVVWLGLEYLKVEEYSRAYRLEAVGLVQRNAPMPEPQLRLLTQQQALMRYYRTEAREGMNDVEVEAMRRVSSRYAYPPAMMRYAIAAGLNGRSAEAELTLRRLCAMHAPQRCQEARDAWQTAQSRYPQLRAIPVPVVPARVY